MENLYLADKQRIMRITSVENEKNNCLFRINKEPSYLYFKILHNNVIKIAEWEISKLIFLYKRWKNSII